MAVSRWQRMVNEKMLGKRPGIMPYNSVGVRFVFLIKLELFLYVIEIL